MTRFIVGHFILDPAVKLEGQEFLSLVTLDDVVEERDNKKQDFDDHDDLRRLSSDFLDFIHGY